MDEKKGNLGTVGKYDVKFENGNLVVSATASEPVGTVAITITLGAKQVIDAIAAKIGGAIPAEAAKVLESALGLS